MDLSSEGDSRREIISVIIVMPLFSKKLRFQSVFSPLEYKPDSQMSEVVRGLFVAPFSRKGERGSEEAAANDIRTSENQAT